MNIDNFLQSLPIMGKGMIGIFIVIGVIMVIVVILGKLFPDKDDDKK